MANETSNEKVKIINLVAHLISFTAAEENRQVSYSLETGNKVDNFDIILLRN